MTHDTRHTATHNRKARYFVLKTDNVLYYWKSPQHVAKKSNGRVPLTGAKVESHQECSNTTKECR